MVQSYILYTGYFQCELDQSLKRHCCDRFQVVFFYAVHKCNSLHWTVFYMFCRNKREVYVFLLLIRDCERSSVLTMSCYLIISIENKRARKPVQVLLFLQAGLCYILSNHASSACLLQQFRHISGRINTLSYRYVIRSTSIYQHTISIVLLSSYFLHIMFHIFTVFCACFIIWDLSDTVIHHKRRGSCN